MGEGETLVQLMTEGEPVPGTEQTGTCGLYLRPQGLPHTSPSAVSCLVAEFDIWYNESFFIPEDVQAALKPGSSIRPGMVPASWVMSLVSGTRAGVGMTGEHRAVGSPLVLSSNMAVSLAAAPR